MWRQISSGFTAFIESRGQFVTETVRIRLPTRVLCELLDCSHHFLSVVTGGVARTIWRSRFVDKTEMRKLNSNKIASLPRR